MTIENADSTSEMISVTMASPGWRKECTNLAQSGQDFVLEGVSRVNTPFAKNLCRRWGYRNLSIERGILFIPALSEYYRQQPATAGGGFTRSFIHAFQKVLACLALPRTRLAAGSPRPTGPEARSLPESRLVGTTP